MKKVVYTIFIILLLSIKVYAEDVYDVALFWGQSNMVGYTYVYDENGKVVKGTVDTRVSSVGKTNFSQISGIDIDIINNYTAYNHVNVSLTSNTLYEYKYNYDTNKSQFTAITKSTEYFGNDYCVYEKNNKLSSIKMYTSSQKGKCYLSLQKSNGTNIISYFGKTYYEKTGHKLVVVFAANGGEEIAHFLPRSEVLTTSIYHQYNNPSKLVIDGSTTTKEGYLYETAVDLFQKAVSYLNSKNYKIGTKFYVVFQGEADANNISSGREDNNHYSKVFKKVHNNLKNDLGISYGVIIETAHTNGSSKKAAVDTLNSIQESLINNNDDIILGSNYPYRMYMPAQSQTNITDESTYKQELAKKSYGNCVTEAGDYQNAIHFTSAGLSQIGKESGTNTGEFANSSIEVIFHKNDGTATTATQIFRKGENNKFGYKTDGTPKWGTSGDFGKWKRDGYTLLGWSFSADATTQKYSPYNKVSDNWIESRKPKVSLYAVWQKNTAVNAPSCNSLTYNGKEQVLVNNSSYYTITKNEKATNAGSYDVVLKLSTGAYTWEDGSKTDKTLSCSIMKYSISSATVGSVPDKRYTSKEIKPTPKVNIVLSGKEIELTTNDIKYTYSNNVNPGIATITISGKNNYVGSKTVKFNIYKSSNNNIKSLTVSNTNIKYNGSTTYDATVKNDIKKVKIEATAEDSAATILGLGEKELKEGMNSYSVVVTAEDGSQKTIIINIKRENKEQETVVLSSNNNLKTLTVSNTNIKYNGNTNYSASVKNEVKSIKIEASLEDNKASIKGTGEKELEEGMNTFSVLVIAEDGSRKIYTIIIEREASVPKEEPKKSNNIELKSLTINGKVITLKSKTYNYNLSVSSDVDTITVVAKSYSDKATVRIDKPKTLKSESNIVKIYVSEDDQELVYQVVINKSSKTMSSNTDITKLKINNKKVDVTENNRNFDIIIEDGEELDIDCILENKNAVFEVEGNDNLVDGSVVTLKVTAEDGTVQLYKITVHINKEEDSKKLDYFDIICIGLFAFFLVATVLVAKKKK